MISEAAYAFISRCFESNKTKSIQPYFDQKYTLNGKDYKFTREVFEEIEKSGYVKVKYINSKFVSLVGIEGEWRD